MMRFIYILLLSIFFAVGGYSQVMQTTGGAGGNKFRALKADSFLVVPSGADTSNLANPKYGEGTTGALFVKTADSTLWIRIGNTWVQAGGNFTSTVIGTDTTIYEFVIDSTGAAANRVLFAGAKKIRSDSHFLWDSVNNKLVINHFNHSIGGVNTKLYVVGNTNLNGSTTTQQMRVSAITQVFNDTTNYKPVIVNSSGDLYKLDRWPSGGGGSGTVTSFSAGTLSPLFTTSVATATTTPALSFSLSNAGAYTVFGNQTNASAAPSYGKLNINTIDATGTPSATTYLRGDGSWSTVTGGVSSDSLAVRRAGTGLYNLITWDAAGAGGTAGQTNGDSANIYLGKNNALGTTSGYRNIGLGNLSTTRISTGYDNIGIGVRALGDGAGNVTGYQNFSMALGGGNLTLLTSGYRNIAIGGANLTAITTNHSNIAIGYQAVQSGTGPGNIGIGVTTAPNTGTGQYNTAVGHGALPAAGNKSFNTVMGFTAGNSVSTGSYNTLIGLYAGFSTPSSGSYNIIIGNTTAGAMEVPSATGSYQVNIGNWLYKNSSGFASLNGVATPSAAPTITTSAVMDFVSTIGGVRFPRMTRAQRVAIGTPAEGIKVFDSDSKAVWVNLGASTTTWGAIYAAQDTVATDASFTLPVYSSFVILPTITNNRTLTIPAAASYENKTIVIKVANSAGFAWSVSPGILDNTDATVTALTNDKVYTIYSDGTNWHIISLY